MPARLDVEDSPDPSAFSPTILVITDRRFWRRSIGSEQRIASLVLHLAQRGERITVAYVGRIAGTERERLRDFLERSPAIEVIDRSRDRWGFLRTAIGRITNALGSRLRAIRAGSGEARGHFAERTSPARRHFVQSILSERRPRVVLVEFLRLSYTVFPEPDRSRSWPRPLYLIDTHDVLHQRAERYRSQGARVAREIDQGEETRALADYDALLAIQSHEGALLRRLLPAKSVLVVPHGIDLPAHSERESPRPGLRLGFLGGRDESNRHALEWFLDEVWVRFQPRHAGAIELHVAGQICEAWAPRGEAVRVVGALDSIDDFWPEIDVAINPVRFGSGLKIKNVEALAYGRALITTSIGAEGIEAASPGGLCIADTPEAWIEALDRWADDPAAAVSTGRAGRAYAQANLSTEAAFVELDDYLTDALADSLDPPRAERSAEIHPSEGPRGPGEPESGRPDPQRHGPILVLASRRALEAFTGPVPPALESRFLFLKPDSELRIAARLPDCRLVISKNYVRPELNRWILEARRLGVPTLLLVDGPLEWSNIHSNPSLSQTRGAAQGLFQPILHDAVAGIGEAQNRWIESRNQGRRIAYLRYANRRIRTPVPGGSGPNEPDFDFLITTARTAYFDDSEKAALIRALVDCGRALEDAGVRVLSRLFDEDLQRAFSDAAPSARHDTTGSFADALTRTHCVIGTPSSVLLEAMFHDKPTATLMFRSHPLFYETGWRVGTGFDGPRALAEMRARDPERMQAQQQSLAENVSDEDFFDHCQRILDGEILVAPRPLDGRDREFEHRALRGALGWRARRLAPVLRVLRSAFPKRAGRAR